MNGKRNKLIDTQWRSFIIYLVGLSPQLINCIFVVLLDKDIFLL